MLKVPFLVAVALAIAFSGGIWSVRAALDATAGGNAIRIGAWEAFPLAQTDRADPYARAHRARSGRLLYATAEGLSFTARADDTGAQLDTACAYRLSGHTPPARLWTLYVTDPDGGAPLLAGGLPDGLNARTVLRGEDGSFTVSLSRRAAPGNWLALPQAGRFQLVLTLLDTPAAGSSGVSDLSMPALVRTGCGDAS